MKMWMIWEGEKKRSQTHFFLFHLLLPFYHLHFCQSYEWGLTKDCILLSLPFRQMIQAAQKLSSSLRSAATQCDNFIKTLTGQPNAAANAFANNVGTDFLTLASGNLGAQSLAAAAAAAGASGQQGLPTNTMGTPGRKSISKEERRALKKQRKANRDPNAPKRPPSAYLLFQNEIREDMRQQFKDLSYSDVLGKISEAWKNLTDDQRKVSTY